MSPPADDLLREANHYAAESLHDFMDCLPPMNPLQLKLIGGKLAGAWLAGREEALRECQSLLA